MERILFNSQDNPIAYIADDGQRTICLWNGCAVAYIDDQLDCYGWNGRYLGWIEDGTLYDTRGQAVGFMKPKCPGHAYALPPKYMKVVSHAKHAKRPSRPRPPRRTGTSNRALSDFLRAGAVDAV